MIKWNAWAFYEILNKEQGQERTWFDCNGFDFDEMERRNKDIKDEIFVSHLPVSKYDSLPIIHTV